MKAIQLPAYTLNIVRAAKSMEMVEKKIDKPGENEVKIKVTAAPVNPSDISFIQGRYGVQKPLPAIPGFEACGVVTEAGSSPDSQALLGKRVSCFSQSDNYGTWSEELIVKAGDCLEVIDGLPDEQAACLSINPFTAYAMFELAKKKKADAIVLNAAGSQVARYIQDMAANEGIPTINIVRKEETAAILDSHGVKNVLNQQEEGFEQEFREICLRLKADVAFDAVGGEMTGQLMNNMPEGASVIVYGGLSGKAISNIDILEIIFKNKVLSGFDLNQWLKMISADEFKVVSRKIQEMIIENTIKTQINQVFDIGDYEKALFAYIKNMSAGKVLLKP